MITIHFLSLLLLPIARVHSINSLFYLPTLSHEKMLCRLTDTRCRAATKRSISPLNGPLCKQARLDPKQARLDPKQARLDPKQVHCKELSDDATMSILDFFVNNTMQCKTMLYDQRKQRDIAMFRALTRHPCVTHSDIIDRPDYPWDYEAASLRAFSEATLPDVGTVATVSEVAGDISDAATQSPVLISRPNPAESDCGIFGRSRASDFFSYIVENPEFDWCWKNVTQALLLSPFDFVDIVSKHPTLPWDRKKLSRQAAAGGLFAKCPELFSSSSLGSQWCWPSLSRTVHVNIILAHLDAPWSWRDVCRNNTLDMAVIVNHPNLSWKLSWLAHRPDLTIAVMEMLTDAAPVQLSTVARVLDNLAVDFGQCLAWVVRLLDNNGVPRNASNNIANKAVDVVLCHPCLRNAVLRRLMHQCSTDSIESAVVRHPICTACIINTPAADRVWTALIVQKNPWWIIERRPDVRWNRYALSTNASLDLHIVMDNPDGPWDWCAVSARPDAPPFVLVYPDYPWDWALLSHHSDIKALLRANLNKPWTWAVVSHECRDVAWLMECPHICNRVDYVGLSHNKHLTAALVIKHVNKPWCWTTLSTHACVTLEFVKQYPQLPYCWNVMHQRPDLSPEWMAAFPDKPWNWRMVSQWRAKRRSTNNGSARLTVQPSQYPLTIPFLVKYAAASRDLTVFCWTSVSRRVQLTHDVWMKPAQALPWAMDALAANPTLSRRVICAFDASQWNWDVLAKNIYLE